MTKIIKNKTQRNVHSHIVKAFKIINEFLPYQYVKEVKKHVDSPDGTIRNVRNGELNNPSIVAALLKVSLENKNNLEQIKKSIK